MATNTPVSGISPTAHPLEVNCVYAISGAYGLLPRILYYVTLVFAIFGRSREWLIIGALVSALTYAGTAAIHLMALVASKNEIYDLDIVAAWAVLSSGALAYIGMVHWSTTLRYSRAKLVLITWGFLVGISLIFGRAELFQDPLSPPEPACYSSAGTLLEYPIQLISPQFNCTYKCFSATKPMRQPSEVMIVPRHVLDNRYTRLSFVLVGPIQFAAYAALSFDSLEHTPSQICTRAVMSHLDHTQRENITKLIYNASSEHWYGGYFVLFQFVRHSRWNARKALLSFVILPWFLTALLVDILALPMMVTNIVLNEVSILASNLPTNEAMYAVGQWGPVVNSLLVVIAAIINKYLEMRERAKNTSAKESGGPKCRDDVPGRPDIEPGMEEQTIGVVTPKLAHVETLRDMEELLDKPK